MNCSSVEMTQDDLFPSGWALGQGTDPFGLPFLTVSRIENIFIFFDKFQLIVSSCIPILTVNRNQHYNVNIVNVCRFLRHHVQYTLYTHCFQVIRQLCNLKDLRYQGPKVSSPKVVLGSQKMYWDLKNTLGSKKMFWDIKKW